MACLSYVVYWCSPADTTKCCCIRNIRKCTSSHSSTTQLLTCSPLIALNLFVPANSFCLPTSLWQKVPENHYTKKTLFSCLWITLSFIEQSYSHYSHYWIIKQLIICNGWILFPQILKYFRYSNHRLLLLRRNQDGSEVSH